MAGKREQTPDIMGALISGGVNRTDNRTETQHRREDESDSASHNATEETTSERSEEPTPQTEQPDETEKQNTDGKATDRAGSHEDGGGRVESEPASEQSTRATSRGPSRSRRQAKKEGPSIEWEENPLRKNATYHLSTQVQDELETLYLDLRSKKRVKRSKSEIVEVALRIALEDAKSNGEQSGLMERLKVM